MRSLKRAAATNGAVITLENGSIWDIHRFDRIGTAPLWTGRHYPEEGRRFHYSRRQELKPGRRILAHA
jgi:hypothetical protein